MASSCVPITQIEITPTATVGTTPSISPSPTKVVPTITPIPTLTEEDTRQSLLYFLQENGGCQLPCVWGLMPGMASRDRESYLSPYREVSTLNFYSNNLYNAERSFASLSAQFTIENTVSTVVVGIKENAGQIEKILLRADTIDTTLERYKFGDEHYIALTQYYQLSQVMLEYGQPSRVLFAAFQYDPITKAPYDPISIVIIYDDLETMIEYIFPSELLGSELQGCPKGAKINLFTWSKDANLSLEDIVSIKPGDEGIIPVYLKLYKPIEEATSLSLEEFYQIFQNPEECISTPAELWPPS